MLRTRILHRLPHTLGCRPSRPQHQLAFLAQGRGKVPLEKKSEVQQAATIAYLMLKPQERRILRLLSNGEKNLRIGRRLGLRSVSESARRASDNLFKYLGQILRNDGRENLAQQLAQHSGPESAILFLPPESHPSPAQLFQAAFNHLSPQHRALVLMVKEGKSPEEISQTLGYRDGLMISRQVRNKLEETFEKLLLEERYSPSQVLQEIEIFIGRLF